MNTAVTVLAILGSIATVSTGAAGLVWWGYKLGWTSGKKAAERAAAQAEGQARIETLERQLAETRQELAAIQQSQVGSGHH
jgi:hypothetical protein